MEALQGAEINEAKKVLANEATTLLHGLEAAAAAAGAAKAAFEEGRLSADLPTIEVASGRPCWPESTLATLAADAGLAGSRSEARRLAQGGGLRPQRRRRNRRAADDHACRLQRRGVDQTGCRPEKDRTDQTRVKELP